MLLLFLTGSSPGSTPPPPATNFDQYLFGAASAQGALSRDTDPTETASTLSNYIEGLENHAGALRTDV